MIDVSSLAHADAATVREAARTRRWTGPTAGLASDSKQGGSVNAQVRADMVYFEGPNGGAVFSVGSITWCGGLSHNGYRNNVSRITENVLRAFAAEKDSGQ